MDLFRRMPVILQTEAAECGLAALCMVAAHHGHELNLIRARQRFNISLKGSTVLDITRMAASLGLSSHALTLEVDELNKLQRPAILHWQMNHFVVLSRWTRRGCEIHDPARGRRFVQNAELAEKFTGVAVELTPAPDFQKRKDTERPRIRQLLGSIQGLGRIVGELFALSVALQLMVLAFPYVFQLVVDDVLTHMNEALLIAICAGLAFLTLFQAATGAVRQWCISVVGSRLSFQLISNVMSHLIHLPLPYFEKRHVGDILMRFASVQALQSALTTTVVSALVDTLVVTLTIAVLFLYDGWLAGLVLASAFCILALRLLLFGHQRRLQEDMISREAKEQTFTIETVRTVQSLRTNGGEHSRMARWGSVFSELLNARLKHSRFTIQMDVAEQLIDGIQHIGVIFLAAQSILHGNGMTVGMLFAFLAYKAQFGNHVRSLVDHVISFKLLDLHLQRLADILWQERDVYLSRQLAAEPVRPRLSVRNLNFSYADRDAAVLKDLSFELPEGSMTAIVGPSGAGKTTLLKLLLGLYWPTSGEIHVGGIPLTRDSAPTWRAQVGVVLQEDQLISGSIADNIAFESEDCDMSRVRVAARTAGIIEEIEAQPMGFLSHVGDLGSSLSSGQKQRLLIARALYRQPGALVLDEGTANLDETNEERLAELIGSLDITRIVVAHRPALVRRADRVLQLDEHGLTDVTELWRPESREVVGGNL